MTNSGKHPTAVKEYVQREGKETKRRSSMLWLEHHLNSFTMAFWNTNSHKQPVNITSEGTDRKMQDLFFQKLRIIQSNLDSTFQAEPNFHNPMHFWVYAPGTILPSAFQNRFSICNRGTNCEDLAREFACDFCNDWYLLDSGLERGVEGGRESILCKATTLKIKTRDRTKTTTGSTLSPGDSSV